jgi:hypothetical protein
MAKRKLNKEPFENTRFTGASIRAGITTRTSLLFGH